MPQDDRERPDQAQEVEVVGAVGQRSARLVGRLLGEAPGTSPCCTVGCVDVTGAAPRRGQPGASRHQNRSEGWVMGQGSDPEGVLDRCSIRRRTLRLPSREAPCHTPDRPLGLDPVDPLRHGPGARWSAP